MEKVNLRDLWKISKTENKPLLGDSISLANLDFMDEYLENYSKLDRQLILEKGFFQPIWNTQYEEEAEDVLDQFQDDAAGFIWKNKESYQRIFDVLSAEYEPLWNYDKTSVITDEESGTDSTTRDIGARHSEDNFAQRQDSQLYGAVSHTDVIGQRQDTNVYGAKENTNAYGQKQLTDVIGAVSTSDTIGARSDSVTHGAQSETDTIGAVSNSDIYGAKSGTSEHEIAGFNSVGYSDSDKTTTSEATHTDQHTEAQRTNGHSTASYTDQTSIGAQTNGHTENSRTDTHTDAQHTDTLTEGTHTDNLTQGQQSNSHNETSRTDTLTQGAHKDEHDINAAQDVDRTAYGHKNTHNERTTGNIGVMSTQDLINQEIRLRISSKFYDILFNDIVKNLCSYYDEGYDCF